MTAKRFEKYGLSRCRGGCGHIFQTDRTVTTDYAGAYGNRTYETYSEFTSYLRAGYVLGRAETFLRQGIKPRIIDVGYGNGSFLRLMERAGWDVWGIDVHGKNYGIREVTSSTAPPYVDVITMFDSLEHFVNPHDAVITNSTLCVVSVPHTPERMMHSPTTWKHYKPGEHIHYFTEKSLNHLMGMHAYGKAVGRPIEDLVRGRSTYPGETDNIRTYCFVSTIEEKHRYVKPRGA